jgi:hypothetical protein
MGSGMAFEAQWYGAVVTGFPAWHPPFQDVMHMGERLAADYAPLVHPQVGHALKVSLACCAHLITIQQDPMSASAP